MYLLPSEELDVNECFSIITWRFCGPIPVGTYQLSSMKSFVIFLGLGERTCKDGQFPNPYLIARCDTMSSATVYKLLNSKVDVKCP